MKKERLTTDMSTFSFDNIQQIEVSFIFPEEMSDYVSQIANKVPLANITVEAITKRQDVFKQLFEQLPRYVLSGDGIQYEFYLNRLTIRYGQIGPPALSDKLKIEKSLIDQINIDVNYLVGFIFSLKQMEYSDLKTNIEIELEKESSKFKYSNIANKECKGIFDNGFNLSGISLKKSTDEEKIEYNIHETKNTINVGYEKEFSLTGPINLNKIIEIILSEINELTLKL